MTTTGEETRERRRQK